MTVYRSSCDYSLQFHMPLRKNNKMYLNNFLVIADPSSSMPQVHSECPKMRVEFSFVVIIFDFMWSKTQPWKPNYA